MQRCMTLSRKPASKLVVASYDDVKIENEKTQASDRRNATLRVLPKYKAKTHCPLSQDTYTLSLL